MILIAVCGDLIIIVLVGKKHFILLLKHLIECLMIGDLMKKKILDKLWPVIFKMELMILKNKIKRKVVIMILILMKLMKMKSRFKMN